MSANPNTRAIDNPIEQNGGVVWNRLHSEREDICEALLKEPEIGSGTETATHAIFKKEAILAANWHRELLQSRLLKIDDALDRLMSGTYGNCCKCGRWIEDTKLDFDPAIAFCLDCWQRRISEASTGRLLGAPSGDRAKASEEFDRWEDLIEVNPSLDGVELETLAPFDTVCVRTRNSDYRIFLLNPKSGRVLLEGGSQFVEPVEAVVNGSTFGGSIFKAGWIGIGLRMEFWTNGLIVSSSPVQSVRVEHHTSAEPASAMTNRETQWEQ